MGVCVDHLFRDLAAVMFRLQLQFTIAVLLCLSISAWSLCIQRRYEVIDHDAVVGFAQAVLSGTVGELYLKYKPYLYVVNGCVPFPAVNADGNVS